MTLVPFKNVECKFSTLLQVNNKIRRMKSTNYFLVREKTKDGVDHFHVLIDTKLTSQMFKNTYVHCQDVHEDYIDNRHGVRRMGVSARCKCSENEACEKCHYLKTNNYITQPMSEGCVKLINYNNNRNSVQRIVQYMLKTSPTTPYVDFTCRLKN